MIFFLRWQCMSSSFPPAVIYGIQKEITDLAKCLRLRNHCHINIEKYCLHRKIFLFLFFSNILSSLSHVFFKQYDVKLLSQILGFGSCTFFFLVGEYFSFQRERTLHTTTAVVVCPLVVPDYPTRWLPLPGPDLSVYPCACLHGQLLTVHAGLHALLCVGMVNGVVLFMKVTMYEKECTCMHVLFIPL